MCYLSHATYQKFERPSILSLSSKIVKLRQIIFYSFWTFPKPSDLAKSFKRLTKCHFFVHHTSTLFVPFQQLFLIIIRFKVFLTQFFNPNYPAKLISIAERYYKIRATFFISPTTRTVLYIINFISQKHKKHYYTLTNQDPSSSIANL